MDLRAPRRAPHGAGSLIEPAKWVPTEFWSEYGERVTVTAVLLLTAIVAAEPAEKQAAPKPLAMKPLRPALAQRTRPDPRQMLKTYITEVHTRSKQNRSSQDEVASKQKEETTVWAVERSNAAASIDDLKEPIVPRAADDDSLPNLPPPIDPNSRNSDPEPPRYRVPRRTGPPPVPPVPANDLPDPDMDSPNAAPSDRGPMGYLPIEETEGGAFAEEEVQGVDYTEWPIPTQVGETDLPSPDDGLSGNRQVALTPFPNLDIQSGPLAKYQLPWWHRVAEDRPFRIPRTLEFQTAPGVVQNNGDAKNDNETAYGWYNSLLMSAPFWKEKGIGVQFGITLEPTTYPQVLTQMGAGAFRRAVWGNDPNQRLTIYERLSWGTGFDGIYDTNTKLFTGQMRSQLAYSLARDRELGLWFAYPLGSQISYDPHEPRLRVSANSQVNFYYRHVFPNEFDVMVFVGVADSPGGFMSGSYMSYRLSAQAAWFLQGAKDFGTGGGGSLYTGLRIYFFPLEDYSQISGNPMNRYRAFMPVTDHINMQLQQVRRF